jgi:hypothetical protein
MAADFKHNLNAERAYLKTLLAMQIMLYTYYTDKDLEHNKKQ